MARSVAPSTAWNCVKNHQLRAFGDLPVTAVSPQQMNMVRRHHEMKRT